MLNEKSKYHINLITNSINIHLAKTDLLVLINSINEINVNLKFLYQKHEEANLVYLDYSKKVYSKKITFEKLFGKNKLKGYLLELNRIKGLITTNEKNIVHLEKQKENIKNKYSEKIYEQALTNALIENNEYLTNQDIRYSLSDYINEEKKSFSTLFFEYYDQNNFTKDSDFYKKAGISKNIFSQLKSSDYIPSKKTVFALILGLELKINDAKTLLEGAGYAFYCYTMLDCIVKYCIENEIYSIDDVNEALDYAGETKLFGVCE